MFNRRSKCETIILFRTFHLPYKKWVSKIYLNFVLKSKSIASALEIRMWNYGPGKIPVSIAASLEYQLNECSGFVGLFSFSSSTSPVQIAPTGFPRIGTSETGAVFRGGRVKCWCADPWAKKPIDRWKEKKMLRGLDTKGSYKQSR